MDRERWNGFMTDMLRKVSKRRVTVNFYPSLSRGYLRYGGEEVPFHLSSLKRGEVLRVVRALLETIEEIEAGEYLRF
jgi:hypothetical protein